MSIRQALPQSGWVDADRFLVHTSSVGPTTQRRRNRVGWTAAAVVAAIAGGSIDASQALAATRYAAPTAQGTGNCSSPANACTLSTAVSGAGQGDTVIVAGNQGTYGTPSTPLTSTITAASNSDAPGAIEGAPGQPRPVIYTNATYGFDLQDEKDVGGQWLATSVSDLDIEELASGLPIALEVEGNVDHVIARSPNGAYFACDPTGLPAPQTEVVSDSLCVAGGSNSSALGMSENGGIAPVSITLRNVTAYATGLGSTGMLYSVGGFTLNVAATNVIARGSQADVTVTQYTSGGKPGSVSVTLDHSNYATVSESGGATATPAGTSSNQTAAPAFVNPGGGDFHESAGSPTIDAGATSPANGSTDLDGNPRTIGSATDIGAYEAAEAPTLLPDAPTGVTTNSAALNISVNPNFSATTVEAYVGKSTASENPLPAQSAGSGLSFLPLAFTATGLQPGVVYHYHFVATNGVGTSSTDDATFTTTAILSNPPEVSGLSQSHRTWREGRRLASFARKRRAPVGTTFSFSLDQSARVLLAFVQPRPGRSVKGHCVAPSKKNHRKHACTRTVTRGTLSFLGHAGVNRVYFQGRVSAAHRLPPGRYTLIVTATNAATQRSMPRQLTFTIVK